MKNILEYKGYHAKIEIDIENKVIFGKVEGISDLVNFECSKLDDVEREFEAAVNDYLEFCETVGKDPEREYKGTFNVRISPELHRETSLYAFKRNLSLNQVVEKAIKAYIHGNSPVLVGNEA